MLTKNTASSRLANQFLNKELPKLCQLALYPLLFFAHGTAQQSAVPFRARVLSTRELVATRARLDSALVPHMAKPLEIDPKQVFVIERGDKPIFYIMPVRYDSFDTEVPTHTSFRCGLFILPNEGAAKFYPTIGYGDSEPIQCRETKAVGFINLLTAAMPPTVFIIYTGNTPNAETGGVVIFSWVSSKQAYFEDERLESSLSYDPRSVNALSVRKQLHRYSLHSLR